MISRDDLRAGGLRYAPTAVRCESVGGNSRY